MVVTEQLTANAKMKVRAPVLDQAGLVEVRLADGRCVSVAEAKPEITRLHRFVEWAGGQGFTLHGLENEAEFGAKGDTSPGQPGIIPAGAAKGGWLCLIGDATVANP